MDPSPCRISVLVVSDYAEGGHKDWTDESQALDGLRTQDIAEPFETGYR